MKKKSCRLGLMLFLSVLIVSGVLFAQRQSGSVTGKVVDNEGTALPGVSITIAGTNLMGALVVQTSREGEFRFPVIPPGKDYVLTAEIQGFQTVKKDQIVVSVGTTVRLMIELRPATLQQEVTVTAAPPFVDISRSKLSANFTTELLYNIPRARDYNAVIRSAPGVVGDVNYFETYGSGIRTQQVALDGVNIGDASTGVVRAGLSFDVFEEVEFELGAHPAEVGTAPGAYVNIVTKSGGNTFHGDILGQFFNNHMTESLIKKEAAQALSMKVPSGYRSSSDFSASLGGAVLKDKLWFFFNGRFLGWKQDAQTIVDPSFSADHDEYTAFAKLTFQASKRLKFMGMMSYRSYTEPYFGYSAKSYYTAKSAMNYVKNATDAVLLGTANRILSPTSFADFRLSYNRSITPIRLQPIADPNSPTYLDMFTNIMSGSTNFNYDMDIPRIQAAASRTKFIVSFLGGDHQWKAGIEFDSTPVQIPVWKNNPFLMTTYKGTPWGLSNVMPYTGLFMAATLGNTPEDWTFRNTTRRMSAFLQDTWKIKNRLTLNLGLRYDESRSDIQGDTYRPNGANNPVLKMVAPAVFTQWTLPDTKDALVWKDFSPRLGLAFDIFGDQTSTFKASWSRYNEALLTQYTIQLSPSYPQYVQAMWMDLNANGILETTDMYVPMAVPPDPTKFLLSDYANPDLKTPYTNEFVLGLERALSKDLQLAVSFIRKDRYRVVDTIERFRGNTADSGSWIPVSATDPGADGIFKTSDDRSITVYGVKAGAPASRLWLTNPSQAKKVYQGLDITLGKRMSHGWQFFGSVTFSKTEGNTLDDYSGTAGLATSFDTPNWLINRYGRLLYDRPLVIKLQGSWILPYGFMASGYFAYYTGAPWARTLQVQLPSDPAFQYPGTFTETILAESSGSRRNHSSTNLDLRLEKTFKIFKTRELGVFLDVLNALGESGIEVNQDPGGRIYANGTFQRWPTYGAVTSIYGLRTFRFSGRISF